MDGLKKSNKVMSKVRAKFVCYSVTDFGKQKSVKLAAIYGKEGENADFTKATPFGEITMSIDNDTPASDFFKPMENYYLDFEKVD